MKKVPGFNSVFTFVILCGLLLLPVFFAGCTSGMAHPLTTPVTVSVSPAVEGVAPAPDLPPAGNGSPETIVVYAAASLSRLSGKIGPAFEAENPGYHVIFSLGNTQALRQKIEAGAYADVFISASNDYTEILENEGYFVNRSVQPFASNYVIVVLPPGNPGKIHTLSDLGKPGLKIAMGTKEVPIGSASARVLDNLVNSSYGQEWKKAFYQNVVTYETSEPGIATKVSLGEVDAGMVYESTVTSAPKGSLIAMEVPKKDNYLQVYSIGVMKNGARPDAADLFEKFMLSPSGQQLLVDSGFRPV